MDIKKLNEQFCLLMEDEQKEKVELSTDEMIALLQDAKAKAEKGEDVQAILDKLIASSTTRKTRKAAGGPSEKDIEYQKMLIRSNARNLEDIKNPAEEVKWMALKQSGLNIEYIENPTEEMKLYAVSDCGSSLQDIKDQSEEVMWAAIKNRPDAIQYAENPTDEMKLHAVTRRGYNLRSIENPTEEMIFAALKQDGDSICYVENPTLEMIKVAVKNEPAAMGRIKNPSEEIVKAALEANPRCHGWIEESSPAINELVRQAKLKAVGKNKTAEAIFNGLDWSIFENVQFLASDSNYGRTTVYTGPKEIKEYLHDHYGFEEVDIMSDFHFNDNGPIFVRLMKKKHPSLQAKLDDILKLTLHAGSGQTYNFKITK